VAEEDKFELPVPICEQSDCNEISGLASPRLSGTPQTQTPSRLTRSTSVRRAFERIALWVAVTGCPLADEGHQSSHRVLVATESLSHTLELGSEKIGWVGAISNNMWHRRVAASGYSARF
jgi:hypothetical protein